MSSSKLWRNIYFFYFKCPLRLHFLKVFVCCFRHMLQKSLVKSITLLVFLLWGFCLSCMFILLLAMFTSSSLIFFFFFLHVFQVSTSRGIGLIIGPAIGGYLAQVHFTLNFAYTNFTFLTFSWLGCLVSVSCFLACKEVS